MLIQERFPELRVMLPPPVSLVTAVQRLTVGPLVFRPHVPPSLACLRPIVGRETDVGHVVVVA